MEAIIYALCDPITHEIRYVGKTQMGLPKRMARHHGDKTSTYRGKWLRSLKEQGIKPVVHVLEETCEWVEAEQFWIAYFKSLGARLANATLGGEGSCGFKATLETRAKLSAIHKGHKMSEETKQAIRKKALGNQRALGIKRSDEFKAAVSKRSKGKKITPEMSAKLSELRKGKPWSKKQRDNYELQYGSTEKNYKKINKMFADGYIQKEIADELSLPRTYVARAIAAHPNKEEIKKKYYENRSKRPEVYQLFNPPSKGVKCSDKLRGRKLSEAHKDKLTVARKRRLLCGAR